MGCACKKKQGLEFPLFSQFFEEPKRLCVSILVSIEMVSLINEDESSLNLVLHLRDAAAAGIGDLADVDVVLHGVALDVLAGVSDGAWGEAGAGAVLAICPCRA